MISLSSFSYAEEIEAEDLIFDHCTFCHSDEMYIRPNSFIDSKEKLDNTVKQCSINAAKIQWDQQTIENVSGFLNKEFYKF